MNSGGLFPRRSTVYLGTILMMTLCWMSCYRSLPYLRTSQTTAYSYSGDYVAREASVVMETNSTIADDSTQETTLNTENLFHFQNEEGWKTAALACVHTLLAMAAGVIIAFIGEMFRFKSPGGNTINLAGAIFAITYIGMLGCFMIMLRVAYGVGAVLSLIIVTKMCDIGAYTVGKLLGRHKMSPGLSPGKTVEGAVGGLIFAILGAWFTIDFLFPYWMNQQPNTSWTGLIIFGFFVGLTGMVGDLAESLIKRDVKRKDSGEGIPGFGGFLDLFDSLLLSAPVAFGLWAFKVVQW